MLCCTVCPLQEVEDTDESAIFERATWDRLPLKSWSAAGGRVVLMGDAAHAMYSGETIYACTVVSALAANMRSHVTAQHEQLCQFAQRQLHTAMWGGSGVRTLRCAHCQKDMPLTTSFGMDPRINHYRAVDVISCVLVCMLLTHVCLRRPWSGGAHSI